MASERQVYGLKPVLEALRAGKGRVLALYLAHESEAALPRELRALCERRALVPERLSRRELQRRAGTEHHQGVLAVLGGAPVIEMERVLRPAAREVVLVADGVQDPRNLGALMRCAEFAGALALLVPKHGSSALSSAVAKTSAGASEHLPLLSVTNVAQTLAALKEAGYWCYGTVAGGGRPLFETRFHSPAVLVVGGEHKGMRPLVARRCDELVTIPRYGRVESLNVANAAAVVLMEIRRQQAAGPAPGAEAG
jgi:23S rRNA (guanosine2251-2'-O)-methyltransferase